jgi:hypothetical protein
MSSSVRCHYRLPLRLGRSTFNVRAASDIAGRRKAPVIRGCDIRETDRP